MVSQPRCFNSVWLPYVFHMMSDIGKKSFQSQWSEMEPTTIMIKQSETPSPILFHEILSPERDSLPSVDSDFHTL